MCLDMAIIDIRFREAEVITLNQVVDRTQIPRRRIVGQRGLRRLLPLTQRFHQR
jgi:hypothetical protein